ncbi:MAG: SagB family peptide dehydrogenase [Acidobacteriota bacterium]
MVDSLESGRSTWLLIDDLIHLGEIPDEPPGLPWREIRRRFSRPEVAEDLLKTGALVCRRPEKLPRELREAVQGTRDRIEKIEEVGWSIDAWTFHQSLKRDSRLIDDSEMQRSYAELVELRHSMADRFVEMFGPPPPAYHELEGEEIELPPPDHDLGSLDAALNSRVTNRFFDSNAFLTAVELSVLLDRAFASRGEVRLGQTFVSQRKTSPSGGGLHPIEPFILIHRVHGIDAGLYHYSARNRSLTKVFSDQESVLRSMAGALAAGQEIFQSAAIVITFVARFARQYWKYRDRARGYAVMLKDVGHLSQTAQLVATAMGLATAYSGAIAGEIFEQITGYSDIEFGPLGVLGCGPAVNGIDGLREPERSPVDRS